MADPRTVPGQGGFTLAEMLAALGILLFGCTALIGAMSSSIAQRRSTDARLDAVALCERALHRVQHEAVRRSAGASTDLDLELATLDDQTVPGFPGMRWSASTALDPERPDVWLVRLRVSWLEEGEEMSEEFLRVLRRQLPLGQRVLRFREESPETRPR
jgi:type II secretory pathway pseudopilin PulG